MNYIHRTSEVWVVFNSSGIKLISTSVWDRNQGGNKITDSAIISENVYSIVLPAAKKSSP